MPLWAQHQQGWSMWLEHKDDRPGVSIHLRPVTTGCGWGCDRRHQALLPLQVKAQSGWAFPSSALRVLSQEALGTAHPKANQENGEQRGGLPP